MHSITKPTTISAVAYRTPEDLTAHLLENAVFIDLPHELLAQCLARAAAVIGTAVCQLEGEGHSAECETLWAAVGTLETARDVLAAWRRGQREVRA